MDNKTQSKKQLLEALKKANLPHSYPTLLEYEAKGVIPEPSLNANNNRIYSETDIQEIIVKVREWRKQNVLPKTKK